MGNFHPEIPRKVPKIISDHSRWRWRCSLPLEIAFFIPISKKSQKILLSRRGPWVQLCNCGLNWRSCSLYLEIRSPKSPKRYSCPGQVPGTQAGCNCAAVGAVGCIRGRCSLKWRTSLLKVLPKSPNFHFLLFRPGPWCNWELWVALEGCAVCSSSSDGLANSRQSQSHHRSRKPASPGSSSSKSHDNKTIRED